jgi:tRNA dimethylallyltransferase
VGYRQLWQHLEGECSLDEAVKNAEAATRQLAKRQLTWLRKWPELGWIYTDQTGKTAFSDSSGPFDEPVGESVLSLALNYLERPPL